METLAFIHAAIEYENPDFSPDLRSLSELKLPVSAVLGLAGAVAITVGATPDRASAMATVGQGSTGTQVEAVQKALGVQADGQYGPKTETAIADFQVRQNLKQVDGVVGQETAAALGLDENYKPTAIVDTYSDIGVNIRRGPGLDYRRVGGAADGTNLEQVSEQVVYRDGYNWTQVAGGGWVASEYLAEARPVSYADDRAGYYDNSYDYQPVAASSGRVDTYSNVGLNERSGPGLGYAVTGGYGEGSYVGTGSSTVEADGYTWRRTASGWVASNYLR